MEFIREPHTCTWAEDAATAKKLAELLTKNYYKPDEHYKVMKEYLAENIVTHKFPPEKFREGYGSSKVWLEIEYETRKQSCERDDRRRVKHVTYRAVGSAILINEYRVFQLEDGSLFEAKHFGFYQVYNGKIQGYYLWNDPMPAELCAAKDDQVEAILAKFPERLDNSDLPYSETDYE